MFDSLHGDIVKQVSPTNFDDAGSRFNAFAMRTQVTF
jgi:phosphate-selective porin OprO/OprP